MSQHRSISSALLLSLFSGAKHQKIDLSKLLENLKLSDIKAAYEGRVDLKNNRINLESLGPLLRSLWHEMEDEASGFLTRPLKIGMFSMMCHAIITAGNLRRALLRSARFLELLNEDLTIELDESGDEARLMVHYSNPHKLDSVFFITSIFVIWIRLSCWLVQRSILLERIEFSFDEPEYSDEFDLMFPCRHKFSQTNNGVMFSKKFLSLPITQDSESLIKFLHNAPESLLTQFRSDESTSAQIKRLLNHRNGMIVELDNMSFDEVASELNMTTHTIRRRLKEEGNSFQEIKDSIRREQALTLLENNTLTLLSISEKLGFSETAAFNRAFKKWTGATPGAYRTSLTRLK
ncbi:MAG: AraC-like DNA-binding protein [Oleiphilaceae bacterium]|jgi:AraC-like DNA-binding protein